MLLNERRITFISPELNTGLQVLPIDTGHIGQVGVNLKPGGFEVNMLIDDMVVDNNFNDNQ